MKILTIISLSILMMLCAGCSPSPKTIATPTTAVATVKTASQTATPTTMPSRVPTSQASPITLRYLGHSSFYLLATDGRRIVTDPYGSYPPFLSFPKGIEADVITISHAHADHTATGNVGGEAIAIREPITTTIGQVKITGYPALHGEYLGANPPNIIFVFEIGGAKIVHLGELGKIESADTLEAIADADVMLVPVGIVGSMSYDQIRELVEQTRPRTIVPQHFSLSAEQRWYELGTVDEFLAAMSKDWPVRYEDELSVTPGMPREIVVMTNEGIPEK
jgi:L-ascorbate metabolism protein UlaG (beta-lactamase superfamily)